MTIVHCVCARVWIDLAYTTQSPSRRGEGIHFVSSWPGSRKIKRFLFWPLLLLVSFHSIYIEREMWTEKKELPSDFVTFSFLTPVIFLDVTGIFCVSFVLVKEMRNR